MDKRYPELLDMRRDPKNDDRNDSFASCILCNLCSAGTASGLLQVKTKLIWHRTMNMSTAHCIRVGTYEVITNITQFYNSNLTNFSFNQNSESPVLILFNDVKRFLKLCWTTRTTSSTSGKSSIKLECGPMPNVMAALPNIGGALWSTPQSLTPTAGVPCSNAAKTRSPLKLAGMPQTTGPI